MYYRKKEENDPEQEEADDLVDFFCAKGFSNSSQISHYIKTHDMRANWPHITGIIIMRESDGNSFEYDGGISPRWYKYICSELGLGNNKTNSNPERFVPYAWKRGGGGNKPVRYGKTLRDDLRGYRIRMAREEGIPPYCIFNDKTLDEIVEFEPTTKAELLAISGIGEAKYEKYGRTIMKIVKKHQ